jgi:hypothetical protein
MRTVIASLLGVDPLAGAAEDPSESQQIAHFGHLTRVLGGDA